MTSTLPLLDLTVGSESETMHITHLLPIRNEHEKGEAGCRCDRWGHPCPGCSKPAAAAKPVAAPKGFLTRGKKRK